MDAEVAALLEKRLLNRRVLRFVSLQSLLGRGNKHTLTPLSAEANCLLHASLNMAKVVEREEERLSGGKHSSNSSSTAEALGARRSSGTEPTGGISVKRLGQHVKFIFFSASPTSPYARSTTVLRDPRQQPNVSTTNSPSQPCNDDKLSPLSLPTGSSRASMVIDSRRQTAG